MTRQADTLGDLKEMPPDSDEYRIYNHVKDFLDIERARNGVPIPFDLQIKYREFQRYYGDKAPDISEDFVCVFQKLPFDVTGITILEAKAQQLGVRKGIRINEKLKEFPSEAKVALLHEMIHASGICGHGDDFKAALKRLWTNGVYLDPLII
jgi:hypothetical protein